jgi:predicted branched-subunit amino acid permease
VFVVVAATLFRGKRDIAPWIVAALVALAAKWLLAGNWYIVVGGMAGGMFGAVQDMRRDAARR